MEEKRLTDVELELMNILWSQQEATVREVMAHLAPGRDLAYTSVSTVLRILEKKNFLDSRKEGKTHVYFPVVQKEAYEALETRSLVKNLFSGDRLSLMKCLLENESISTDEMSELKKMIEERMK